ncbi:hypothetical protein ACN47E_004321 [Coniothyrium glycines]
MRLLQCLPDGTYRLTNHTKNLPPYAVLSHTWLENNDEEVTFDDLRAGTSSAKEGFAKIQFCAKRAIADLLEYIWIDTCCIDKSSSAELSEAINSMFDWYQRATKCYVYLTDVATPEDVGHHNPTDVLWIEPFRRSRWFTRGWTLQELLAPAHVEFFSKEGSYLGNKSSLEHDICAVTNIHLGALRGGHLAEFSIDDKKGWMGSRETTRAEDMAYCLFGLFGVFLPPIYGEGLRGARQRLEEEIKKCGTRTSQQDWRNLHLKSALPFARNESFVGREQHIADLEHGLLMSDNHHRATICGLGGSGKSSLVLEFAYRALARCTIELVFWVPAISQVSFELAFRAIATRLNVTTISNNVEDLFKLVEEALKADARDWLMIVDNADDPGVLLSPINGVPSSPRLYDYLPGSKNGTILFTTRSREVASILTPSSIMELKEISKEEARQMFAQLILRPALLDDRSGLDKLLALLSYLPLAIVQAVAFINNNQISISNYLQFFEDINTQMELFGEAFEDSGRYKEMDNTVARTWHISFDHIRRNDRLAAEYLAFIACIDCVSIPQSILPSDSLIQHTKALGTLLAYAFITERPTRPHEAGGVRIFDMHPLVHMASVIWLDGHRKSAAWANYAITHLVELMPRGVHEGKELWKMYLPHAIHTTNLDITVDEILRATLLDRVGLCQLCLGPEHSDTIQSMGNLAIALRRQGKYAGAEQTDRKALALREKVFGHNHPLTVASMGALSLALESRGRYNEAATLARKVLMLWEEVLPPKDEEILRSRTILGGILFFHGKYEETEVLQRQTLAWRRELTGETHPDTIMCMADLAQTLSAQGKGIQAQAMVREAATLAKSEAAFGPDHPITLVIMNNMAQILMTESKHAEAQDILEEVLNKRNLLQPGHPDTVACMASLAVALGLQGRAKEAEVMTRKAITQQETMLGHQHPTTIMSRFYLSRWLEQQDRWDEASDLYQRTCDDAIRALGKDHPYTRMCQRYYAAMIERRDWLETHLRKPRPSAAPSLSEMSSSNSTMSSKIKRPSTTSKLWQSFSRLRSQKSGALQD